MHEAAIDDDPAHPARERTPAIELTEVLEDRDEHVLRQVLRELPARHDAPRQSQDLVLEGEVKALARVRVTTRGLGDGPGIKLDVGKCGHPWA